MQLIMKTKSKKGDQERRLALWAVVLDGAVRGTELLWFLLLSLLILTRHCP